MTEPSKELLDWIGRIIYFAMLTLGLVVFHGLYRDSRQRMMEAQQEENVCYPVHFGCRQEWDGMSYEWDGKMWRLR